MSVLVDVVAAVIQKNDNQPPRYLVVRRGPDQSGAGQWEFPGGKVESGESYEAALLREIKEELNLDIRIERFLLEHTHEYPNKSIRLFIYLVSTANQAELQLSDHDAYKWQLAADIDELELSAADRPVVAILKNLS